MSKRRSTPAEVEHRRERVLRLRFARLGEAEIARQLAVSASTVSRDLAAIHEHWGDRFRASFDLGHEIAEAAEFFSILEAEALKELIRLDGQAGPATGSRIRCLWAARAMREAKLDLLATAGLLTALPPQHRLPRAAEIRAVLQAARREARQIMSPAEVVALSTEPRSSSPGQAAGRPPAGRGAAASCRRAGCHGHANGHGRKQRSR